MTLMNYTEVKLTIEDLFTAAHAGVLRRLSAIANNRKHIFGDGPEDLWGNDIESCIAEMLVSRSFNVSWRPYAADPNVIKADVGDNIQVRSTKRKDGCLIMHKKDKDDQYFVLVTGSGLNMKIKGWIKCADGKKQKFWRDNVPNPAYFVPQSELITP